MQMQVIGHPLWHCRRADVVAVRLGNVHHLLGRQRDAGADKGIVLSGSVWIIRGDSMPNEMKIIFQ